MFAHETNGRRRNRQPGGESLGSCTPGVWPMTQGMSPSPRLNRSAVRLLAPYSATLLLGFALIALDPNVRVGEFAAAFGLACMVPVLVALLPWRSVPRSARLAPIAHLLHSARPAARLGRRRCPPASASWRCCRSAGWRCTAAVASCAVGLAGVAAFWPLPVLLIGGAEYPLAQLRSAVMYVAVASIIGLTVQRLVGALAAQAQQRRRESPRPHRSRALGRRRAHRDLRRGLRRLRGQPSRSCFEPDAGDGRCARPRWPGITAAPMAMHTDSEPLGHGHRVRQPALGASSSDAADAPDDQPGDVGGARPAGVDALRARPCAASETVGVLVVGWTRPVAGVRTRRPGAHRAARRRGGQRHRAHRSASRRLGELAATDAADRAAPTAAPGTASSPRPCAPARRRRSASRCSTSTTSRRFNDFTRSPGRRPPAQGLPRWPGRPSCVQATSWPACGGEEFAVLLNGCTLADAAAVVERLRGATPARETCSAGLVARQDDEPAEELMAVRTMRSTRPSAPVATSCSPPEAPQPAELHSGGS